MKGVRKFVVALVLAALLAVGISACGGDDASTSTTSSSPTSPTTTEASTPSGDSGNARPEAKGPHSKEETASKPKPSQQDAEEPEGSGGGSGSSGSAVKAAPLRVSGGGSAPFREPGGDNSIQDYGSEGDQAELEAAAEAVHSFLVTRAREDWATACSYLSSSMVKQLEELASQSEQLKGKGCAPILDALTASVPDATRTAMTEVDAASLRYDEERAFLLYHGADDTDYFIPMVEEQGNWKVSALASTPFYSG